MTAVQKDNSTGDAKIRFRRAVLHEAPPAPLVLETHGGFGRIFERTWFKAAGGLVMEKVEEKAEALARQRQTWRVYQGDSLKLIQAGVARDMRFDIVDLDPYGSPVEYLDALASSGREWPDRWQLVVNDGLRKRLRLGVAWSTPRMRAYVLRHGNNLYPVYLTLAREIVEEFAASIGFAVVGWHCYATGEWGEMTHYWAKLERLPAVVAGPAPGAGRAPAGGAPGGAGSGKDPGKGGKAGKGKPAGAG